jgi:hypothetical protein
MQHLLPLSASGVGQQGQIPACFDTVRFFFDITAQIPNYGLVCEEVVSCMIVAHDSCSLHRDSAYLRIFD